MVTIFDMVTGELLHSETTNQVEQAEHTGCDHALLTPRLQTVEEAQATTARPKSMPADLALADIARFIRHQ